MTHRADMIEVFLQAAGWASASRKPLKTDASNRHYTRLNDGKISRLLMDANPDLGEDVAPFIAITAMLLERGLSAPQIYHADIKNGFLLIEDFGDALFKTVCADDSTGDPPQETAQEITLYNAAIDVLVKLHKTPAPETLAVYDIKTYLREAALLTEWYVPAFADKNADVTEYNKIITALCSPLMDEKTLTLRDYHAENLIWLPTRTGEARVGLLDYQDALLGHAGYDLVSLLMDARRDTSADLRESMLARYTEKRRLTGAAKTQFISAYHRAGAQRNCKILGIFTRLCARDGKAQYGDLLPRVWQHLQSALHHPDCQELANWVDKNIPAPTPNLIAELKIRAKGNPK